METKNPLEEVRNYILQCQQLGIEDEFSEKGISDEVIKISNALDLYYGINRLPSVDHASASSDSVRLPDRSLYEMASHAGMLPSSTDLCKDFFRETKTMLHTVRDPLVSIKNKVTITDTFYLNLSSAIVSIALKNVVLSLNSYKRPAPRGCGILRSDDSFDISICGVDLNYRNMVLSSLGVMNYLKNFDMTHECKSNYEENHQRLQRLNSYIEDRFRHSSRNQKKSSSGCLVFLLLVSTSLFMCFGGLLIFLK